MEDAFLKAIAPSIPDYREKDALPSSQTNLETDALAKYAVKLIVPHLLHL